MQQNSSDFRRANKLPERYDLLRMDPKDVARILLRELASLGRRAFIPAEIAAALSDRGYDRDEDVDRVLMEGFSYLEHYSLIVQEFRTYSTSGVARQLSRQGEAIARNPAQYDTFVTRFKDPRSLLHPTIVAEALPHFDRGPADYDTAVFTAFKAIEVAVRAAAHEDASVVGVPLMNRSLGPTGALCDPAAERGEQEGMRNLFAGAMGVYKNPPSHRNVGLDDARRVFHALCLASELLFIVDERVELRDTTNADAAE